MSSQDRCLCLIGDFNCVRNAGERRYYQYRELDYQAFNNFILDYEIFDVIICNFHFTWCGKKQKLSRLDRALINVAWKIPDNWEVKTLERKSLDHRAVLMSSGRRNWGPKPFKFFDCWLDNVDLVKSISLERTEAGDMDSLGKPRQIKKLVKSWNKKVNGDISEKITLLEKQQFDQDESGADDGLKFETHERLSELYETRACMLSQKARIKWQIEGDRNTKFFQNYIKARWNKSQILKVYWRDNWCLQHKEISEAFFYHFSDFSKQLCYEQVFFIENFSLKQLTSGEAKILLKKISLAEVELALKQFPSNKAHGNEGFNMGFFKQMWDVIKLDISALLIDFLKKDICLQV